MEIPTHVDDPQLILHWTIDEFSLAMGCIGLGFATDNLFVGLVVAWAVVRQYRRHGENHARGYLQHLTYRYGLSMPRRSHSFRNAYIRFFAE